MWTYRTLKYKKRKWWAFYKVHGDYSRLQINIPFSEVLGQMQTYAKFMKELLSKKRNFKEEETIAFTKECNAII